MKIIGLFLVYFLLRLIAQSNAYNSEFYDSGTTIIGTSNATFSWKIQNYDLIDWKIIQNPKIVVGPLLKARDGQKVNCSLVPLTSPDRINDLYSSRIEFRHSYYTLPKLICDFDPEPTAVRYSYTNGDTKESGIFLQIRDNMKDIEIVIDGFYAITQINERIDKKR